MNGRPRLFVVSVSLALLVILFPLPATTLSLAHLNELRTLSLRAPFRMSGNGEWRLTGTAEEVLDDQGGGAVRLTRDGHPSSVGGLWTTRALPDTGGEWEVTLTVGVWGTAETYYGDGLALWFVEQPSLGDATTGKVFGSRDYWKGLGIMFDTYDNGQQSTTHPFISVFVNDGTQSYVHGDSGLQHGIPACHALFRRHFVTSTVGTTRHQPSAGQRTQVKVRKVGERLLVDINVASGSSINNDNDNNNNEEWTRCIDVDNVRVPDAGYYFGLTSSTGDLSDNHDVYEFVLRTKSAPAVTSVQSRSEVNAEMNMARQVGDDNNGENKAETADQDDDVARIVEQSEVIKMLKAQGEDHDAKLNAIRTHLVEQIRGLTAHLDSMTGKLKQQEEDLLKQLVHLEKIGHIEIDDALMAHRDRTHWGWPFFGLTCVVCFGGGFLYRRFAAEKKKHLL